MREAFGRYSIRCSNPRRARRRGTPSQARPGRRARLRRAEGRRYCGQRESHGISWLTAGKLTPQSAASIVGFTDVDVDVAEVSA